MNIVVRKEKVGSIQKYHEEFAISLQTLSNPKYYHRPLHLYFNTNIISTGKMLLALRVLGTHSVTYNPHKEDKNR